ncbi:peptidyl-prolyl cis-trans isomerase D [[Candida] jaroonii]|uniref:Peptidyl-prolyl cis-trans isomerase D n=1 Tax=[Candida] jaroonii TaxID=467808 RepID=A0ACA9YCX9_9ASCO|nr:peptidyl-prolyl cis-trans isomerase D [[Candida] jaroonii]
MKVEIVRPFAFLDISIGGKPKGRIVVELFDDLAPNATTNFFNLVDKSKTPNFVGNYFHRVVKNFVIQAGDVVNCIPDKDYGTDVGKGNISTINEGEPFGIENGEEIDGPFKLCTANNDPNANGSQFFITTYPSKHLTGKHSVFGAVKHGKSVVREIERVSTNDDNVPKPNEKVVIEDCGVWDESMDIPIYNACYDPIGGDIYEEYPDDDENIDKESSESVYNASVIMKDSGSQLLKLGRLQDALFKYTKCLRYVMEYIPDDEQEPQWYVKYYDLKKKLYLNMSLVNLQLKDYKRAIDFSDYLLDMNNLNNQDKGKGYYRRGMAELSLNKYELAVKDFTEAVKYVPNDKNIQLQLEKSEKLRDQKKMDEKAKYAKFFK